MTEKKDKEKKAEELKEHVISEDELEDVAGGSIGEDIACPVAKDYPGGFGKIKKLR